MCTSFCYYSNYNAIHIYLGLKTVNTEVCNRARTRANGTHPVQRVAALVRTLRGERDGYLTDEFGSLGGLGDVGPVHHRGVRQVGFGVLPVGDLWRRAKDVTSRGNAGGSVALQLRRGLTLL